MKLKYMGPKPVINEHGINFKDGKDDKYVYISHAINILNAINHNYQKGRIYKHEIETSSLDDNEVENIILKYKPQLQDRIENEISSYKLQLNNEISDLLKVHPNLLELELTAFKNNLLLMKDYRIQRAINKIYYIHIIEIIVEVIRKHKIKNLKTPFNERFWHILQTLQGVLSNGKDHISSQLEEHDDQTLELSINIF